MRETSNPRIIRYLHGNQTGTIGIDTVLGVDALGKHVIEVYKSDSQDSCDRSNLMGIITEFRRGSEPMLICMKGDGRHTVRLRKTENEYLFPSGYFYVDKTFEEANKKSREEFFNKYSDEKNN